MSKIYQGNFQSSCRLTQLFLDISAVIFQKKRKSLEKIFFCSENAIWSILLKYQKIGVQIQFYIVAFLNGTIVFFFNPNLYGRGGGGGGGIRFQAVFCYSSKTVGARSMKLCGFYY